MQRAANIARTCTWGRWSNFAAALFVLCGSGLALAAEPKQFAKPVSAQLNATGKAITMPVPMTAGDKPLGDVVITINADDSVSIPKSAIADRLGSLLDAAAAARLAQVPAEGGAVSLEALTAAGFNIAFDHNALALHYEPAGTDRATDDLSLGNGAGGSGQVATSFVQPAAVAGYVNITAGADHNWNTGASADPTALTLELQPVLRGSGVALAGDWTYQSTSEPFICPVGAICLRDQAGGLKRTYTRAIYDHPQAMLRLEVGDSEPLGTEFQTPIDTLGLSLEHSSRKLNPGESVAPSIGSSFRLERPSDVDVLINGAVVRHLHLAPGPYNLKDIPLQAGANEVVLDITDDTGQHRTQAFNMVFDATLLAPGESEWGVSAGIPSYLSDGERVYRGSYLTATGFYRSGLTNSLTGEVQAQADNDVTEAGGRVLAALPIGFASLGAAGSAGRAGIGYSTRANWSLTNAKILLRPTHAGVEALTLGAEYRSAGFHAPGEYIATAGDVIFPQFDYSLRFDGTYSAPVTETVSASLSGRYSIGSGRPLSELPRGTYDSNRYGIDLSLAAPVNSWVNGSLSVGYGNDFALDPANQNPALHASFRLSARPDQFTTLASGYDSGSHLAVVSGSQEVRSDSNRWNASLDVQHDGLQGTGTAGGSLQYSGNRFQLRATHWAGFDGDGMGNRPLNASLQRSSINVGTAIAFADGKFAFGAPVRGDAFAIVAPHESLAGRTITIGEASNPRGQADGWGPALVGDLPANVPANLSVDVADLPLGYSLGEGSYSLKPPFRGGYALEVGSAHSVSAYGTLIGADGQPVALLTGTATAGGDAAHQVAIFTNATGRFGADGLAPGHWVIEMATDGGPTHFALDIPAGTNGLFKAGILKPAGDQG